jgi:predicted DNA-binding transcriptional regulator AlpA
MADDLFENIKLLTREQVASALGCSPYTLDQRVRRGSFPRPLQAAAGGRKLWRYVTVQAWITKRERARYVKPSRRGRLRQWQEHE